MSNQIKSIIFGAFAFAAAFSTLAQSVYVSRFWHNHQPIYWPEWNSGAAQDQRVQYAKDSVDKWGQTYPGSSELHPCNILVGGYPCGSGDSIFDKGDRVAAYQYAAKNSLEMISSDAGFAMSYSGSLIDNIRSLGNANSYGYGPGWNNAFTQARNWQTTSGGASRLDMTGFTYHHSLAAVLPKEVLRKEIQLFKEAWRRAWGGQIDHSDHSKGFFPTEMAFSPEMLDVVVDEGYEWITVASHHISRTSPSYLDQTGHGANFSGICISPPNKADLTGPVLNGHWWYLEPNPCNASWNVSPYAFQLHWTKYVDPETGTEKKIITVPSDDAQSYVAGYSGAQEGLIDTHIAPYADPNKPSFVMPATDGDNAWGGGSSSYFESTPAFFGACQSRGYGLTSPQDFVNNFTPPASDVIDVEPGAWMFPEGGYGSPYFLKWIEPPLDIQNYADNYPNTKVDFENADAVNMKFWIWGPIMAGANWCETAEQITEDQGGSVQSWKIAYPYDWDGTWNAPNDVELAWHIFLAGFDSGFGYYGGVGNDDEVKTALATRRAQEKLDGFLQANINEDRTPPTVFRPQRFPWNPGGHTFGWFNPTPTDGNFLKEMPSDFYVWSLVYDLSGIASIDVKIRIDNDGFNPVDNNENDTYAGGPGVGSWTTIPMTTRPLLNDSAQMNALANNSQINYFIMPMENADLAYAKIDCVRGALVDYYIEAVDTKGNVHKSDIFHVYVEDDGTPAANDCGGTGSSVILNPVNPSNCDGSTLEVGYVPNDGPLSNAVSITISYEFDDSGIWNDVVMTDNAGTWEHTISITTGVSKIEFAFNDGGTVWDNNDAANWTVNVTPCPIDSTASIDPANPEGCIPVTITYDPGTGPLADDNPVWIHMGINGWDDVEAHPMTQAGGVWEYVHTNAPGTEIINAVFRNASETEWDNNNFLNWNWDVIGCAAPSNFNPSACAIEATPALSSDPVDQNDIGDNFDLNQSGGGAPTTDQNGFGNLGTVFVNYDDTYLYLGGYGADMSGNNNAMAVFVGLDTLTDDVNNLWNLSGKPYGLDDLHNIEFTQPMDIAILLGDEWGDGQFPDFDFVLGTNNYNLGQGVYTLGGSTFGDVIGMTLSQFDGTSTNAVTSTDDDGNRTMERWEVKIPFSSLNASNIHSVSNMYLCGVLLSNAGTPPDRYLSGNFIAQEGGSNNGVDEWNNFGMSFVTLEPYEVCLPHMDGDNDGLMNKWELDYYGHPAIAVPTDDTDGDGHNNMEEQALKSNPHDTDSALIITQASSPSSYDVTWKTFGGVSYIIQYNESKTMDPNAWQDLITIVEDDVADGMEDTENFVDDFSTSGQPTDNRIYRIKVEYIQ